MAKVSVIMACYNAGSYITFSIQSVLNQTFKDFELIVVDDASKDDSLVKAKNASISDPRVSVFSLEKNSGAGAARNFALSKAKGEWLCILDADDNFLKDKIEKQLGLIEKGRTDYTLIGTDSFEIDQEGKRFSHQKYPHDHKTLVHNLIRQKRFPPHSSLMFKTDAVKIAGGYDNRLCPSEDYNLWLNLSEYGSFASVPEPLIEYRHHLTNISNNNSGFDQLRYGIAACVCYYIRHYNFPDPLKNFSEYEWLNFISWISNRLKDLNLLEYRNKKRELKMQLFNRGLSLSQSLKMMAWIISNPGFMLRIYCERLNGTKLPKQLAKEWIDLKNH